MTTGTDLLGGKAANLVALRDAGFPVPPFVVLDTGEYAAFVTAHGLGPRIEAALRLPPAQASEQIRAAFRRPVPDRQRARIEATLTTLGQGPVAVRSSATAEDLPEASFAGQQDTFLDVRGTDAVLAAVIECWSSLWTERAITYRARNEVPGEGLGLAVVVQELVAAEASGVLFTADPLTGHRGRTVVDAVPGLGEKLVSGQVTPDHVEVDTASGRVLTRTPGSEATLTDTQVASLVDLGRRIAAHYGHPQDIEWTRVGEEVQVVQSRAVTSLYPLPEAEGEDLALWLSFGSVQGVLGPLTPLGQDVLCRLLTGVGRLFGLTADHRRHPFLRPAGERLWVRADGMLRREPALVTRMVSLADPAAAALLRRLATEPGFGPRRGHRAAAIRQAAPLAGVLLVRTLRNLARPEAARRRFTRLTDALVADLDTELAATAPITDPQARAAARVRVVETALDAAMPTLLPTFGPIMLPSVLMLAQLRSLAARTGLPDAEALALGVLRSLPGNVTTEMDLALYAVATTIRADPPSRDRFTGADPAGLAADLAAGTLPPVAARAVTGFLARYGMRGVAEIDVGAPRWRETPETVLRTVVSYLDLPAGAAPDTAHERGRREALAGVDRLAAALPAAKARRLRFLAGRLRGLFGMRETPKFTLVRLLGLARTALLAAGADLVAAGRLEDAGDVVFLSLDELRVAFRLDVRDLVTPRRAARAREQRRTRVPILMLGDGRTFYDAPAEDAHADLTGTGVSPGVVEGPVRVVDDPRTAQLRHGEILVCRGTDPAWTPLFLTAAGLVTEVGGLMTHGSVVAREYGLPAVVGVGAATTRLRTGQRIRLDGSAGTIEILDAGP